MLRAVAQANCWRRFNTWPTSSTSHQVTKKEGRQRGKGEGESERRRERGEGEREREKGRQNKL